MPEQTSRYWMPDGQVLSRDEGGTPLRLEVEEFLSLAREHTFGLPIGFFLGMAERESALVWNQEDTDYDSEGNPRPNKTYGLLMLTRTEMAKALSLGAILPGQAVEAKDNLAAGARVMARLRDELKLRASNSDFLEEDMWRYICWAHNAGMGNAGPSAANYGIDWAATLARNPYGSYAGPGGRLERYTNHVVQRARQFPHMGEGSDDSLLRLALLSVGGYLAWKALR